jgi:hypothetical protein
MKKLIVLMLMSLAFMFSSAVMATGLATCDSGPEENWQAKEVLQAQLEATGWTIRRIKVDGGCYEVYAVNEKEERVEAYFHPVTLEPVATEEH